MIYSTKTNQSEEDSLLVTVFAQCCTHKVCSVTCCTFQSVQSSPGTLARCWSCRACGCHLNQTTHRDTVADRVHPLMATALCNQWPPHQDNDPTKNWNATERPESSKRRPHRQRVQSDRSSACEIRSDRWRPQVPKGSTAARLPSRQDTSALSPSTFSVFLLSLSPESGCLPAQILIPKHQQITFSYK